jgi:putative MATE family efflux protein
MQSDTRPDTDHNKRISMLSGGPIGSTLFKLSAPAIAGMVVIAIYNVVDTFFVSLLRDTTAVAATGIVFPIFQLIGAVGLTFGMGAASVISRRLGSGDHKAADETAATALYSVVVIGLLVSAAGAVFARPILGMFGATESILDVATLYGRVIIAGSVFQMINMTVNNILRAEGASLYSSAGQILGAVLNIILDPIFIFVFDMGVAGAAVATVISQAVSTAWLLAFYLRRKGALHPLSPGNVTLRLDTYRNLMELGLPTLVRQVLGSVSFAILNNAAAAYGDPAIAAVSVTLRLFMLLIMALIGLAQGLQPLAGYNYGARQYHRVRATIRLVFAVTILVGAGAGLASFIYATGIMRIFVPQDPDVITMGTTAIRIMSVSLIPTGLVIMFGGIFQALGDGRSALLLAVGQQGAFLIPMVIILPRLIGLTGVFAAQPSGFIMAFLVGLVLYRRAAAALHAQEAAKEEG